MKQNIKQFPQPKQSNLSLFHRYLNRHAPYIAPQLISSKEER